MDEHTRLHIPIGVDVKVLPPTCEATIHIGPIVPEIADEKGPCASNPAQSPPDIVSLLGGKHEGEIRFTADGDVLEVPDEIDPLLHHEIRKFVTRNLQVVLLCLGHRGAEEHTPFPKKVHDPHNPLKMPLSPAEIRGLFEPLHADNGRHISQLREPLGHLLVDQGSIRIDLKDHVPVFFEKAKEILANKGLSP